MRFSDAARNVVCCLLWHRKGFLYSHGLPSFVLKLPALPRTNPVLLPDTENMDEISGEPERSPEDQIIASFLKERSPTYRSLREISTIVSNP